MGPFYVTPSPHNGRVTDAEWVAEQVAQAPPLSMSRRNRLALLLAGDPSGIELLTREPAALASR